MNHSARPNIEDTENNNVDENSNDHEYNQYATYHNQFINHEFRNHSLDNGSLSQINNFAQGQQQFYERAGTDRLQNTIDEIDSQRNSRYSNSLLAHRRNLSEDLSVNSNDLPPLPSNSHSGRLNINPRRSPTASLLNLHEQKRPLDEEIRDEGRQLLHRFAAEQFEEEHLNLEHYLPLPPPRNLSWEGAGRSLRELADEFSRSQEREMVRREAQRVDMSSLTLSSFFDLCRKLFDVNEGGITSHRIIVLFTFIADVAIYQVRQRTERFIFQLMEWSLSFIYEHVCAWVREAGGWEVVLSQGVNFMYKITFCMLAVVSIVAMGVFIKKNWKDL